MDTSDPRPLIAHVVHRFGVGGLENGVVNLINRLPRERFRHAVVAMTEVGASRERVRRDDVQFHELHKPPGQGLRIAPAFMRLMRSLGPAIVHTRNLGALEMALPATLAGVPVRVHGEHGWDSNDPDGRSLKCRLARRVYRPLVHRWVALSQHLRDYLVGAVGVPAGRIERICNGVDTQRFHPAGGAAREPIAGSPFDAPGWRLVGTVGRLAPIKDQVLLARAFARAHALDPLAREHLRLVIAGDGPLRPAVEQALHEGGVASAAWLAGERDDVPALLRGLDGFVLPSQAEGISNTILEAMATRLPIIATAVGGNVELLEPGRTGVLVPSGDVEALAAALLADLHAPNAAQRRASAAHAQAQQRYSLDAMVANYGDMYQRLLDQAAQRGTLQRA